MPILPDSSLSTFLLFPIPTFLSHLCPLSFLYVSAQCFLCSSLFCISFFSPSLYTKLHRQSDRPATLIRELLCYSINYSSINSVIALLLSIHTPHNRCPIHPISPHFLPALVTHLFHHSTTFPSLFPNNTCSVCHKPVRLNIISFSFGL